MPVILLLLLRMHSIHVFIILVSYLTSRSCNYMVFRLDYDLKMYECTLTKWNKRLLSYAVDIEIFLVPKVDANNVQKIRFSVQKITMSNWRFTWNINIKIKCKRRKKNCFITVFMTNFPKTSNIINWCFLSPSNSIERKH